MIADESFCTRILGSLWWISHRARKERREQKRSRGNRKTYLLSLIVGLELRWLRGTAGSGCPQISTDVQDQTNCRDNDGWRQPVVVLVPSTSECVQDY
jgi:hypothetical protein